MSLFKKWFFLIGFSMLLTSCFIHAYHTPIQQGNILDLQTINHLHTGMSLFEVKKLLGEPVLRNSFNDRQLLYVYHLTPNYGKPTTKRLILTFNSNGTLIKIDQQLGTPESN